MPLDKAVLDIMLPQLKPVFQIEGTFWVPDYQRGYRWGDDEVTKLLDDIWEFGKSPNQDEIYCLQPLVVKKTGDHYELIDGQQRLTTIRILLTYIRTAFPRASINYTIIYETRKDTEAFLNNIDAKQADDNIDFFFISKAYQTISKWFANKAKESNGEGIAEYDFYSLLGKRVKFIWYEADSHTSSIELFTRLNIGRIPLTDSELVKALFLSKDSHIGEERQLEIVQQWDMMERHLNHDDFWYFLSNEDKSSYQTHIDLLLNIITDKQPTDAREKHFAFFWFYKKLSNSNDKYKEWQKIWMFYLRLCDWYENRVIYHKVGYLIAIGGRNILRNLLNEADKMKKSDFQKSLDKKIAETIDFKRQDKTDLDYSDLSYDEGDHKSKMHTILLLFNVQSILDNGNVSLRFPFNKFKEGNWSLEHIHAQHSEGLPKMDQQKKWLELHLASLQSICPEEEELKESVNHALTNENLKTEEFKQLAERILFHLSPKGNAEYLHQLSNMALLQTDKNAALNNSTFDVKRNRIIQMDKEGCYIPYCTRMVFLKYYTESSQNQLHFWGEADRSAYISAMNEVLQPYLSIINRHISQ